MRLRPCVLIFAAGCLFGIGVYAQAPKTLPNLEPKSKRDMRLPTINYELVLPGETEARHVLSIDSAGNAAYRSGPRSASHEVQTGEARNLKFTVSQPTCARLFELAKQANFFEEELSTALLDPTFARGSSSFTTLRYSYGPTYSYTAGAKSMRNSITFVQPPDSVIQQLASILERMSEALERGEVSEASTIVE